MPLNLGNDGFPIGWVIREWLTNNRDKVHWSSSIDPDTARIGTIFRLSNDTMVILVQGDQPLSPGDPRTPISDFLEK